MTIFEYERLFQDLFIFSTTIIPIEYHKIERSNDDSKHELSKGLVTF
jgi:hypothetical protein